MRKRIQACFAIDQVVYTRHARDEMRLEGFGPIREEEVAEAIQSGEIIESYEDDEPYPSVLIFSTTSGGRRLHIVCAYASEENLVIVITVYEPDPNKWINYERRRRS